MLTGEHEAFSGGLVFEDVEGFVDLIHLEGPDAGGDIVACAEVEHGGDGRGASDRASTDGLLAQDEREDFGAYLGRGTDEVKVAFRGEHVDVGIPVELDVYGADDEVKVARGLFEGVLIFAIEEMMGSECLGLFLLGGTGRDRGDLAAPFRKELQGDVTESTDTHDGDAVEGADVVLDDGIEDSDAPAKKRAGGELLDAGRDLDGPCAFGADAVGEAPVATHDGALGIGAEVVVSAHTLMAGHAGTAGPTHADVVAGFEVGHGRAYGFDGADDFVAWHKRVLRHFPIVLHHAQVAVANPAGVDFDIDLGWSEVTEFVLKFFKLATLLGEGVCGDSCHIMKGA